MRTLHLIVPRRTPSRRRLVNTMLSAGMLQDPVRAQEIDDGLAMIGEGAPDRGAPGVDRAVPLGARRRGHDVDRRHRSACRWEREHGPRPFLAGEFHMRPLYLFS